jgi:hypothetical protein
MPSILKSQHLIDVSGQLQNLNTLPSRDKVPKIHWITGWPDPRASKDMVTKRKNPAHAGNKILLTQFTACTTTGYFFMINLLTSLPSLLLEAKEEMSGCL